ncbi:MAG: response regulator, partial [Pseudomonadales bacterium]
MNTVAEQQSESRGSRAGLLMQARAMVVEDDSALLEAIVDTLELSGCEVVTATSAEQALQKLAECAVDIVISDVNMRGMDGHQLLGEIKRSKPHLPVVLITAYGSIQH